MSSPELFTTDLITPHGIVFDDDEILYVAEISKGRIQQIRPDGKSSLYMNVGGKPSGLIIDDSSDMFLADSGRHNLLLISPEEGIEVLAHQSKGKRFVGPQCMYFAPTGELFFTDAGHSDADVPSGSIFSVDLNGDVTLLASELAAPMGLAISEDAGNLFVAEVTTNRVVCFTLNDEGELEDKETFLQFEDGRGPSYMIFDTEGILYVGRRGIGITLVDPDGKIIAEIPLPGPEPRGMTFGGLEFDELYIAEAQTGAIYRMPTQNPGQRPFVGPRSI